MKVATNNAPVERFGVIEDEHDFRIKPTPKAFAILTSKLYKDKITAVVRELSCNAYDSHIEAGCPEIPFDVHLPNTLSPELVIRDYGTGLSDRDVREVFTTFFESTKENTNEQIGALGLGCKSPFSYCDTYTVKSFFKGVCTTFVCFIENALPKVRRVSRTPTDEPNGLEIHIAVAPADYDTFQRKATKVFKWFPIKPNVVGGRSYSHANDDQPIREGADKSWYFARTESVSKAVMGNVAYPIDEGVMGQHLTEFERRLLKNFVFYFRIGEVDVQAGREELSYDRATIRAVKRRIAAASKELSRAVEIDFKDCKTFVEANTLYLRNSGSNFLFELVPPRWKGKVITGGVAPPIAGDLKVRRNRRLKFDYPRATRRKDGKSIEDTTVIEPWSDTRVYIDDLKRGGRSRFNKVSYELTNPCYLFKPEGSVADAVKAFADFPHVLKTSDIPVERNIAKVRMVSTAARNHAFYLNKEHRHAVDIDLDVGGYYLLSKASNLLDARGEDASNSDIFEWMERFYLSHPATVRIYVVPWALRKQFNEHPDWKNMIEDVMDTVEEKLSQPEFVQEINQIWDRDTFGHSIFERSKDIGKKLPKTHPLNRFLARYYTPIMTDAKAWSSLIGTMALEEDFAKRFGKKVYDPKALKLPKLWDALSSMPLLKAVVSNSDLHGEALDDLAAYARMAMDKKRSSR